MAEKVQKPLVFYGFLILLFLILAGKLFHLQIYQSRKYWQHSEQNRIHRHLLQPTRGLIYDRFGNILVDNRPAYTLKAIPYECSKSDSGIALIARILKVPESEIRRRLRESEGPFSPVRLKRDVDFGKLVQIEERRLELPGFFFQVEPRRLYPAGINAAHLFGYLGEVSRSELRKRREEGLRPGDIVGKKGLEKVYDSQLRGEIGYDFVEVDALGREIEDVVVPGEREPIPGDDLYLTIDLRLQKLAEELFRDKKGGLILIDVRDGGILAMCSKPDYNPEVFSSRISPEAWRRLVNDPDRPLYDRMVQSEYPPGSTFKLVLAAAALDKGFIKTSATSTCKGYVRLGLRTFKCWKPDGHGTVDLLDAIKYSCNVYFYRLALKVGIDPWAEYARKFGFGYRTGVDLLGESRGLVPDREYLDRVYGKRGWTKGMLFNLGIGQGDLLVTPMQMAQFAMMLANGGSFYTPHLLYRIFDHRTGQLIRFVPEQRHVEGISPGTFDILRQGMFKVVNEEHGTGRASAVPGIAVAGKTGTAQNPHGDPHAWFIGFAPFEEPQVAICVFVENGGSGGGNAAPISGQILRKYFGDRAELP